MVRKVAALSNLVCRILIHPTSLPSYVIGLASLLLAGRAPGTKNFLDPYTENQPPWKTQASFTHFYTWFGRPTTLDITFRIWELWTSSLERTE